MRFQESWSSRFRGITIGGKRFLARILCSLYAPQALANANHAQNKHHYDNERPTAGEAVVAVCICSSEQTGEVFEHHFPYYT